MENQLSHLISNFTIKIKTAVHVHTYNSTITKQLSNSNLKNSRKFKLKKNIPYLFKHIYCLLQGYNFS